MDRTRMPAGKLKLDLIAWIASWSPDFEQRVGLLLSVLSQPCPPPALTLGDAAKRLAEAQRAGGRIAFERGRAHGRQSSAVKAAAKRRATS